MMRISCTKKELAEFIAVCAVNFESFNCDDCPLSRCCQGAYIDFVEGCFNVVEGSDNNAE